MDDPLLEQLLADAESYLGELGVSNAEAAEMALGTAATDLESEREDDLRLALVSELDRRHGPMAADAESSGRAAEEWPDRGALSDDEFEPG